MKKKKPPQLQLAFGDLKQLIASEASTEANWVVRPGQLLVRRTDEPSDSWRWQTFTKPLYFNDNDIVKRPGSPMTRQVWVFRRDDMLISVAEYDFFSRPDVA